MRRRTKKHLLIFSVVVLVALIDLFYSDYKMDQLKTHGLIHTARITGCDQYRRRNQAEATIINYTYSVKGKTYEKKYTVEPANLPLFDCQQEFAGRTFPVIYDSSDPDNATLLVDLQDYNLYNIPFPDSLNRIMRYFPKK